MLRLRRTSLEWALKSIRAHSDTYIFPEPFEYEAINYSKDEVLSYLENLDVLNEGLRESRTALTPKSVKGFRISTQLDPLDSIISHAVIYEIADEIEQVRIPKSEGIVHSFRLHPNIDGIMFDPEYTWDSFMKKAEEYLNSGRYSHVLVTDISDFYSSVYLHHIETVLREAVQSSGKTNHADVLINYIKAMYLNQTHRGMPIGPQFSRPIGELILNEIDKQLLQENFKYTRYVDDFFIFATSETQAFTLLSKLAQTLYDQRNLKLNEKKTEILSIEEFAKLRMVKPAEIEKNSILFSFHKIIDKLGLNRDPYIEIEPEDLSKEDWNRLRAVNIFQVLRDELSKKEPDTFMISFLLGNLARTDNCEAADFILQDDNIYKLFPKLKSIIHYLEKVRSFSPDQKEMIGKRVLDLIRGSIVGTLSFNRMWFLNLFVKTEEWDNQTRLSELYRESDDPLTKREVLYALGRAKNIQFYRSKKNESLDSNPWVRRAFLAGISCLPREERNPYYRSRSLRSRDYLDKIVESWARNNPFCE